MEAIAKLSWVLREHRAGCRFRLPSCPFASRPPFCWPVARHVRLRNPIKSTIAHDAVAAVVLHKPHLIIRVGAGLIQFVYGSHLRLAADLTLDKNLFFLPFSRAFPAVLGFVWTNLRIHRHPVYKAFHRIRLVVTNELVCSNSNVILTRHTCGQHSSRVAGSKRQALAFLFSRTNLVCVLHIEM